MEILQNILVLITFIFAVYFVVTKFFWKPAFLMKNKSKNTKACGDNGCGCH